MSKELTELTLPGCVPRSATRGSHLRKKEKDLGSTRSSTRSKSRYKGLVIFFWAVLDYPENFSCSY